MSPSRFVVPTWRRIGSRFGRRRGDVPRRGLHVVVCIGTVEEWASRSDDRWNSWVEELAAAAADEGVSTLTLFPAAGVATAPPVLPPRQWIAHGVTVRALCEPDGRHRLAETVNAWPTGQALTEETLGRAVTGSSGDPDVVAVVGAPGRLPPALVWELAYAELVDVGRSWADFDADDLRVTMREFRTRHRRFGGLGGGAAGASPDDDRVGE